MARSRKSLCEDIGILKIGRYVRKANHITLVFVAYKMAINLDVFSAFVKNWIGSNTDCTSVVCIEWCGTISRKSEIGKQPAKPENF